MAANNAVCLSCSDEKSSKNGRSLECFSKNCNNFIHYECTVYKPAEIRLLESNKANIKWFCGKCESDSVPDKKFVQSDEVLAKLAALETVVKLCNELIIEQGERLRAQEELIQRFLGSEAVISGKRAENKHVNFLSASVEIGSNDENIHNVPASNTPHGQQMESLNVPSGSDIRITRSKSLTKQGGKNAKKKQVTHIEQASQASTSDESSAGNAANMSTNAEKSEGFQLVTYRKQRKTLFGRKADCGPLKAVEARCAIFVSRLDPATSEADVKSHLENYNIAVLECSKLEIRSKDIAAFRVSVKRCQESLVLSEDMWPENAIIRHYYRRQNFPPANTTDKNA